MNEELHRGSYTENKSVISGSIEELLLYPSVERALASADYAVSMYGTVAAFEGVSAEIQQGKRTTIDIGMGTGILPTPGLLAYLEMGIQRALPLWKQGYTNVGIRLFSAGSLRVNGGDLDMVYTIQHQQRTFFNAYLQKFYPEWKDHIDLSDIEQVVQVSDDIDSIIEQIRERVSVDTATHLEASGRKHGGEEGAQNALRYAACHVFPDMFGSRSDKGARIAVGCSGEHMFNEVRHTIAETDDDPGISLVINGVLSKTGPYLNQHGPCFRAIDGEKYNGPITLSEFKKIISDGRLTRAEAWGWQYGQELNLNVHLNTYFRRVSKGNYKSIPQYRELLYLEAVMSQQEGGMARLCDFIQAYY